MNKLPILLLLVLFSMSVSAQELSEQTRKDEYNLSRGLAIKGYDPVAYFTAEKAVKGYRNMEYTYKGVRYYFSSEKNRGLFKANPEKYEPAYGGWCSYAMGESGKKVSINPETFKILDGTLYLFYNSWGNNTLPKWNKDEKNLKAAADKYWQGFISK